MPIFARNKQIRQDLKARQRKRKIEAKQDQQTWSQWDKRRLVLVGEYDDATQTAQHPNTDYHRTKYQMPTQRPNASHYGFPPSRTL